MALLLPPPPPMLGPLPPAALYMRFQNFNSKQLANSIYSIKLKVGELYEYLQYTERLAGLPITPIPDKYVGISATKPFPDEITPPLPMIRAYRVDGSLGREIWNTQREIGGGGHWNNNGYVDILEGTPAGPSLYWLLEEKLKTEALDRRSPALVARYRWRKENL